MNTKTSAGTFVPSEKHDDPAIKELIERALAKSGHGEDLQNAPTQDRLKIALQVMINEVEALRGRLAPFLEAEVARDASVDSLYASYARKELQRDGELEFDDKLIVSYSDEGAYIAGWTYVSADELADHLLTGVLCDEDRAGMLTAIADAAAMTEDEELVRLADIVSLSILSKQINMDASEKLVKRFGLEESYEIVLQKRKEESQMVARKPRF